MNERKPQREDIVEVLQRRGKRITKQRLLMLDVILSEEWGSCKEIYYEVSRRNPAVGKATVYRMIAVLEEIGVLNRKPRMAARMPQESQTE